VALRKEESHDFSTALLPLLLSLIFVLSGHELLCMEETRNIFLRIGLEDLMEGST
jgi:hypothetical protein